MRIAFYAPLKPPTSSVPSGDRRMAALLIQALETAGHGVELASVFRSRDGSGDGDRQRRLGSIGGRLADRVVRRYRARAPGARPRAWFTYHLYHQAPDWIGPRVAAALDIPYIVAEASFAPKQAGGPWAVGHAAAEAAIRSADVIIGLNSHDSACVLPLLDRAERLRPMPPFTDIAPFAGAADARAAHRQALARLLGLDPATPVLLAVAMMRPGDKLASYVLLGRALALLEDESWQLVVVGDGAARPAVEQALAPLGADRVRYAGQQWAEALPGFYAAADILVWPAIREAYGMALVEAQAAGLPVVAGRAGGVADIVRDGETGLLAPEGDAPALAAAIRALLRAPDRRARLAAGASRTALRDHSIAAAAAALDEAVRGAVSARAA